MSSALLRDRESPVSVPSLVDEALIDLPDFGEVGARHRDAASDYEVLANFRHALRCYMAESERVANDAGLTAQRFQALLAICTRPENAPISVGELARHLVIRPHSAAELVARLEGAGLVKRAEDPLDRRRVLLGLTEEGERRLQTIAELQLRELAEHRQTFSRIVELLPEL